MPVQLYRLYAAATGYCLLLVLLLCTRARVQFDKQRDAHPGRAMIGVLTLLVL